MGDSPLSLLVLNIKKHNQANPNFERNDDKLNELLLNLDSSLVDEQQMVFIRRNLRFYQQDMCGKRPVSEHPALFYR